MFVFAAESFDENIKIISMMCGVATYALREFDSDHINKPNFGSILSWQLQAQMEIV